MIISVGKRFKKVLVATLLATTLLQSVSVSASSSRYAQNGSFNASGSPMLNPNFTMDQWNKWEMVAWGVFLSNFVVPMADSYESAFSTSSTKGSRGAGYKALDFSQASDTGNNGILQNFLKFAIDNTKNVQKDLFVTYYYLDQVGNIIKPLLPTDINSAAVVLDKEENPTMSDIQPESAGPANFTSLLPYNLADALQDTKNTLLNNDVSAWLAGTEFGSDSYDDVFGVNGMIYRPWKLLDVMDTWGWSDLIAIPPSAGGDSVNRKLNKVYDKTSQIPKAYASQSGNQKSVQEIAVAKLPVIWLKGADGTYEKVWDMLDPWDYQVLVTMLAKEVNSDGAFDTVGGTKKVWEVVTENIDKAFDGESPLKMDCFGNITTLVDGEPLIVIPAAYNKHITTTPMVNLVNSLFLTGPTSGVSEDVLLDKGKMPVKSSGWWYSNENETASDGESSFGPGMPAFGWKGSSMPNNAVALYYDSDSLAYLTYKDRVKNADVEKYYEKAVTYSGVKLFPQAAALLGVLDLDLNGNRKYERKYKSTTTTDTVVPRITLTGMSKAAGLGADASDKIATSGKGKNEGTKALMTALTFQEGIVGLLPASYKEVETEYVQKMTWQNVQSDVLGSAVVIPVAMQSGSKDGTMLWSGLARDFVSYYGTTFYPNNKNKELPRLSKLLTGDAGGKEQSGNDVFVDLTKYLMYDSDNKPTLALISHAKTTNMTPYMNVTALSSATTYLGLPDWGSWLEKTGFIWKEPTYIKNDAVDTSWFNRTSSTLFKSGFASMSQRWVKAYPTNRVLTNVASYLGMRGDSEFAAAAAPYVYLSYLDIYGVASVKGDSGVNVSTLNENPTKFNENIFDAKGSPIFSFNPSENTNIKTDADKQREVRNYTYELLSPTGGHEYKRQLLSNIQGNFVYDQYNKSVYGGSLEYRSGGVQQVVTRSQTGFLRFPSLDDNVFTRWFYEEYATVALSLLALGLVVIIILGIFRGRKLSWFFISSVLLVTSVVVIPFVNDVASQTMDGLVTNILKNKTTMWSLTEFIANSNIEEDYMSTDLTAEEAEIAADITKSMSIAYTDRSLMLKQDISHKVISLGNFAAYQQFASTRWMLPSILRQFTADDSSNAYLYVPLLDVADDAANAYWWYNPSDASSSGGIAASDLQARYAVGTQEGTTRTEYIYETIQKFYPNYHWIDTSKVYKVSGEFLDKPDETIKSKLSYRSVSQSVTGTEKRVVPIHDYIYMYMNNAYDSTPDDTQQIPVLPVYKRPDLQTNNALHSLFWGDASKLKKGNTNGGSGTYLAKFSKYSSANSLKTSKNVLGHGVRVSDDAQTSTSSTSTLSYDQANIELMQTAQKYIRDQRDTMYGEFAYLWSTETTYPYFYALVKDTMDAMGKYDYKEGTVDNTVTENAWGASDNRLGLMLNALTGSPSSASDGFYKATRSNFMYQSGASGAELHKAYPNALLSEKLYADEQPVFTGYVRDVLDLESMFYNVIPYMYQMTIITGGLTGSENDTGLFGDVKTQSITESMYRTYKGLPQSWLYRCNWASKIVEAPAYNKSEKIGYYVDGKKQYDDVTMTYLPEAYHAVKNGGRDMIFSEAQFYMSGLRESDLTTLELKLIKLNKEIAKKWTTLINYINANGMTAEVMCRQMALDAMTAFNEIVTPSGLGNTAFALLPSSVDLRSLSFDTVMRVILLNASKDTNFFGTDAMESTITEFGMFSGICLLITAWVCVYGVTIMRAFFLAFIFLMGVYGVARGVFASNTSKKATLFGYLTNIAILFALSFLYYEVFNILMTGANSTEYVNNGLRGTSASPTVAILIVLVASCVYIWLMFRMFRIALGSVISGSHDLGFGTYKDKAQAVKSRISKSISDIRSGHSMEGMSSSRQEFGSSVAGISSSSSSKGEQGSLNKQKRRRGVGSSAVGSGSHAVHNMHSDNRTKSRTTLEDYESIDATIGKGDKKSTPTNPAMNLDDYLNTPSASKNTKETKI